MHPARRRDSVISVHFHIACRPVVSRHVTLARSSSDDRHGRCVASINSPCCWTVPVVSPPCHPVVVRHVGLPVVRASVDAHAVKTQWYDLCLVSARTWF